MPVVVALLVGFVPPAGQAQTQVDVAKARQYAQQLESNFWEQAWARHLEARHGEAEGIDWDYTNRQDLNELTADFQRAISDADGFWQNLQVQDYLQRQLLTVQPNPMMVGRPGAFRVRILSTTVPNALALNDGTFILTTGLLSTLESEAQLHAVLAHEVAHVVLDHALTNYKDQKPGRARKVFGALLSGVKSAITVAGVKSSYRPGRSRGQLESTVYGLKSDLATKYLDRKFIGAAGLKYSQRQEEEANRLAQEWLLTQGHPPSALNAALRVLYQAGTHDNVTHGASFVDSHPVGENRWEILAEVVRENGRDPSVLNASDTDSDLTYDTQMAALLEQEAEMDLTSPDYHAARTVLDRVLRTEWTTPRTYLYKAIAVRNTTTGSEGIEEALSLLAQAEAILEEPEPRIEAERVLLRMREGQTEKARQHLERCIDQIEAEHTDSPDWTASGSYDNLYEWALEMRTRLGE